MEENYLNNSESEDFDDEDENVEYFSKNDGERLASFFQVFDSSCIDNEFEDGNQNLITSDFDEKNWEYNPNNLFNHTIDDLKRNLEELKKPLLDMVDGKIELDQDTFNSNTLKIKFINWFLNCNDLHSNLNKEVYIESLLSNEIINFQKKIDVVNDKIADLKHYISTLENQLSKSIDRKSALESANITARIKWNLLQKYASTDSDPLSIIPKCVFLKLINSSVEELTEFKSISPVEIHYLIDEVIYSHSFKEA